MLYSVQAIAETGNLNIKMSDLIEDYCQYTTDLNTTVCIQEMLSCIDMEYHTKELDSSKKALEAFNECYSLRKEE